MLDSDGHLKGASVSSIALFSSTVVVQFREAAHLKNASILTGIESSQLTVYKNKQAFDGKEEPLGLHSVIDDLGASKDDALVVVVPISAAPWKLFGQKGRTAIFPAPGTVIEMEPSSESRIKEQPFIPMPPRTPFSAARAGGLAAHSLTLADGRNLEYYLDGVVGKPAVFLVHGQFSTGRMWIGSERNDLFLVMPTRPNYGGSSHHAGYTYSTFANDLQQLADHLQVRQFHVIGAPLWL